MDCNKGRLALGTALLLLGFGLRVIHFSTDRFHADEALYAGWALRIPDAAAASVPSGRRAIVGQP